MEHTFFSWHSLIHVTESFLKIYALMFYFLVKLEGDHLFVSSSSGHSNSLYLLIHHSSAPLANFIRKITGSNLEITYFQISVLVHVCLNLPKRSLHTSTPHRTEYYKTISQTLETLPDVIL